MGSLRINPSLFICFVEICKKDKCLRLGFLLRKITNRNELLGDFFSLYNYKLDVLRSNNHFESALINFYYGYLLSKTPNIKIHGYLGR